MKSWAANNRVHILNIGFLFDRMSVQIPSEAGGGVQEIQKEWHDEAANEHGNRPEHPQEEREGQVECSKPKWPEEASPVQVSGYILDHIFSALRRGHGGKEANVGVVPYRLHVAEKRDKKADQDGKELDGGHDGGLIPIDQFGWGRAGLVAHVHTYKWAQSDGCRRQQRRRHYIIAYCLNCQHTIF